MNETIDCTNCCIADFKHSLCDCHGDFCAKYKNIGDENDFMQAVLMDRPTWIPCSERLPRAKYGESENVLASCESGHIHLLYFDGGNWCYPTGEAYEHNFDPVIAWMPLPEPWKGADNDN